MLKKASRIAPPYMQVFVAALSDYCKSVNSMKLAEILDAADPLATL